MKEHILNLKGVELTTCDDDWGVRELTFEEEIELYKEEAKNIFDQEDPKSESSIESNIIRRGMRIIEKVKEKFEFLEEKYKNDVYQWIPVSEKKPNEYQWVLVKTSFEPDCAIQLPHMAELRKGVWYTDCFDGPLEETLDIKVIAWFEPDLIVDDDPTRKSNMEKWAEEEVRLACKRERLLNDSPEGEWDYGCACLESALKAFKSLMKEGHSGCSIGITKNILNRLIENRPLTPIEDTEDVWGNKVYRSDDKKYTSYQCKRMSSLFKDIYDDGHITYHDVDSNYATDIKNGNTYHNGIVQKVMDEMFPIIMPYNPEGAINFYCEEFLTDKKNGDYDTVGVLHAIKPNGDRVEVNKFFKDDEHGLLEITLEEYNERMENKIC